MIITYLGHAGFCVETTSTIIVLDPWLSPFGAFDSSWFQYPRNHHMAQYVIDLFNRSKKEKYIYISHEHKDHFDPAFLNSLENRDFSFILAEFQHPIVKDALMQMDYQCKQILELKDKENLAFQDGSSFTMFVIDSELECDSAVLIKANTKTFLNINDCKINERLETITKEYGPIDVFAAQFSGAIWHPTCYDYDLLTYEKISLSKKTVKFELTARAIETVKPTFYFPSAGPPCFLDPMLIHKNFEPINIFPRAPELIEFLNKRCKDSNTQWPELMPGDALDVVTSQWVHLAPNRLNDAEFYQNIHSYANEYTDYFYQRELENNQINPQQVFLELQKDLEEKIKGLKLVHEEVTVPLYWKIQDYDWMYQVNFKEKTLTKVKTILDTHHYYLIEAPAWQVHKALQKEINWPDFALTFRVKLSRKPDLYNTLIHGFITLDANSIGRLCELMKSYLERRERIIVHYEGKQYSILRYCKHQGADLSQGWIENGCLVCPRHRWHYDLKDGGKCTTNLSSIEAICLGTNTEKK
ncbi:MAG: Rieske 2Fe-2S domain-containing protein [Legionella sp.]|uniref:Rieske 2Fe-2S domain-containing protein n=1 Tax=Legionella sp. TaxID=459 RepID=UPI00284D5929|nr:Rieske 2Fe-2S domain-containing protein [Legionella sp.]